MKSLFELIFVAILVFPKLCFSQDSLYLISTITGISNVQRITDVKGIGDVNGDGYGDFIISERTGKTVRDMGIVKLYFGSANVDLIPDVIFHYPGKDSLNDFCGGCSIGDINNDGYNDFAINGIFGDWGRFPKGKSFIYLGGAMIDTVPIAEFYELWVEDCFRISSGVGDMNKDGYDDFVARSPGNWTNGKGYVYLFFGGDTISWERSITFTTNILEDFFGASADNIGDINGDGFDEIAIGAPNSDSGLVYLYYGGNPMDTIPDTILTSNNFDYDFGRMIKNAGDLNKDGVIDFCIAGEKNIYVYNGINNPLIIKGYSVGTGGDINKDNYDDVIIGNDWKINIYFGSPIFDTTYKIVLDDPQHSLTFSTNISIAWDINNDGYDDVFAFSPNWPHPDSALGKAFIFSYKKVLDVIDYNESLPIHIKLHQNYPNPFNSATNIEYEVQESGLLTLIVYDLLGREIKKLVNTYKYPGKYSVFLNAENITSGVYLYRLTTKNSVIQKKMILLR